MTKKLFLFLVLLILAIKLSSQEEEYVKPDLKPHYNIFASFPTTRGFGYNFGVEREQIIIKNTSFASSVGVSLIPVNTKNISKSAFFGMFIQPFHIVTGGEKWKLESGISVSYLDFNLFNNQNILIKPADKIFFGNLFIGARYAPTKKIAFHAGYVPRLVLGGNKTYYQKFFHGVELSLFYKI